MGTYDSNIPSKIQGIRYQNAAVADTLASACEATMCVPNLGFLDMVEFECSGVKICLFICLSRYILANLAVNNSIITCEFDSLSFVYFSHRFKIVPIRLLI